MKKAIDADELVRTVRERLARKYAGNKKQFWEDLRKIGNGGRDVGKRRRTRGEKR